MLRFARRIRDRFQKRDFSLKSPELELLDLLLGGIEARSGVKVNPLTVLGVPTVFACVRRITGTIKTTPIELLRKTTNGTIVAAANPLHDLMATRPNPWMTSCNFFDSMASQAVLRQNAVAVIHSDNLGIPREVVPVDEVREVTWKWDADAERIIYTIRGAEYDQSEVLHFRNDTKDGIAGNDLVYSMKNPIGLAIALQDNAADFFANGSRPSGAFTHPARLGDKAYARLKSSLNKKWNDAETDPHNQKAYGTLLLEEGLKYEQIRHTNRESQMDDSRKHQNLEICRIFGVPPHKVGILDRATFNNIEEQSREYVADTVLPWVVNFEQELNAKLLTQRQRVLGFHYKFNLDSMLRANLKDRYESYQIAILNGILNKNEVREKEDLPPYDGGELYIEPMNHQRVGTTPANTQAP